MRSRVLCLGYRIEEASDGSQSIESSSDPLCSQASDSMWRMPGHTEAMKAVVSCDKPRGAAHTH
jgi:hypothetical protein